MLGLSASVESKKAVSGWKPVLGTALPMEWMNGINFLAICVTKCMTFTLTNTLNRFNKI